MGGSFRWFTQVQRDVRDIADIERIDAMKNLVRLLACYASKITNYSSMGREINLDGKTAARYTVLLEQLFLVKRIEAWQRNDLNRLVKSPKTVFIDSGILTIQRGLSAELLARDKSRFGALLENFVYSEIVKQASLLVDDIRISHYRDRDGKEVDFILENAERRMVGIEVKAAASVKSNDFKGLRHLVDTVGDRLICGCVLYDGEQVVPFGGRLYAVPIASLWAA